MKTTLLGCYINILLLTLFLITQASAHRIVSLSPSATASLILLNATPFLYGVTFYCKAPEHIERVGTLLHPNIEKIIKINPTLVILSTLCKEKHKEKMEKLGLPLFIYKKGRNFSEVCTHFLALARILQKEEEGRRIVEEAKKLLPKKRKRTLKLFWQVSARPLITVSKGSYAQGIIEEVGAVNIFSSPIPYPRCTIEEVIRKEPDVIIVVSRDEEEGRFWERYPIKAVKEGRIYILPPALFSIYTPMHFAEAVRRLHFLLYE